MNSSARVDLASEIVNSINAADGDTRENLMSNARRMTDVVADPLDQFQILARVFEDLGQGTPSGIRWRDHSLPIWLHAMGNNSDLIKSITEPMVPNDWTQADEIMRQYVAANIRNQVIPRFRNGFVDALQPGIHPAAFHPLALRHLHNRLKQVEPSVALPVVAEFAERCNLHPVSGILASELILEVLIEHGLEIDESGAVSAGRLDQEWQQLSEHLLSELILSAESIPSQPEAWRDQSPLMVRILSLRAAWSSGKISLCLSAALKERIKSNRAKLAAEIDLLAQLRHSDFAMIDTQLNLNLESRRLPPINRVDFEIALSRLTDDENSFTTKMDQSRSFFPGRIEQIAKKWQDYRASINSPFVRGEPITVSIPSGDVFETSLVTEAPEVRNKLIANAFANGDWKIATNSREFKLASWKALDSWNKFRGAAYSDDVANQYSTKVIQSLPNWVQADIAIPNVAGEDALKLRESLAAISLLGIADHAVHRSFITSIDRVTNQLADPASELSQLLVATKVELLITNLSKTEQSFETAMASGAIENGTFRELSAISKELIDSSFAFESRAAFNGFLLLGRLADLTGDPTVLDAFMEMQNIVQVKDIVLESGNLLLEGNDFSTKSSLGLAAIAQVIANYQRELDEGIREIPPPDWIAPRVGYRVFYEQIVEQLSDNSSVTGVLRRNQPPCRALLLTIARNEIAKAYRHQELSVEPVRRLGTSATRLRNLLATLRYSYCRDQISAFQNDRLQFHDNDYFPWWRISFWVKNDLSDLNPEIDPFKEDADQFAIANSHDLGTRVRRTDESVSVPLQNWASDFAGSCEAQTLSLAEELEAQIVSLLTASPVNDIDGFSRWQLPMKTWDDSFGDFDAAIVELREAETRFRENTADLRNGNVQSEVVSLLQLPLILDTADYQEQVFAALAEVRSTEAALESARHNAFATELEAIAAELVKDVAKLEIQRQEAVSQVVRIESEIADANSKIASLDLRNAQDDQELHDIAQQKAELYLKKQRLVRSHAAESVKAIKQRVKIHQELLVIPPDPNRPEIKGKIGLFGAQIEEKLVARLEEDIAKAEQQLQVAKRKERERKRLERRRRFVNSVCRFAGAVVGAFVGGGPAGAALGAEIGGAIGETINGAMEDRPIEEILVGLSDNAFAIAEKSGLDLESELNEIGAKTAKDANKLFTELDSTLGPILQALPQIFDKKLVNASLIVLGFDQEIPQFVELLDDSLDALSGDVAELGTFGTFLRTQVEADPLVLQDKERFAQNLQDQFFQRTQNKAEQLKAIAKQVGLDFREVTETDEGRQLAASRLAQLVVHQIGQDATDFRTSSWGLWLSDKQAKFKEIEDAVRLAQEQDGLTDDQVEELRNELVRPVEQRFEAEKEKALTSLFPNPRDREVAEESLNSVFKTGATFQGEAALIVSNWQKRLNERLAAARKDCEGQIQRPRTEVEVAQSSVDYLKEFREHLVNGVNGQPSIISWLKTDGREGLDVQLRELEQDLNNAEVQFELSIIDVGLAEMDIAALEIEMDRLKRETERKAEKVSIADFRVKQSQLAIRIQQLAKRKAVLTEREKDALKQARTARHKAALAQVVQAEASLRAAEARALGRRGRAAVAREIRQYLSQPPLSSNVDNIESIANSRHEYTLALRRALIEYRNCLRQVRSFQDVEFDTTTIFENRLRPPLDSFVWSERLALLQEHVKNSVQNISVVTKKKFVYSLNERQIDQLSGSGLLIDFVPRNDSFELGTNSRRNATIPYVVFGISNEEAATGRIAAIILRGTDDAGAPLVGRPVFAKHLGVRRPAVNKTRFTNETDVPRFRVQLQDRGDRTVDQSVVSFFDERNIVLNEEGLSNMFARENGTSLSGETTIRLEMPQNTSIREIDIIIFYLFFEEH